MGIHCIPLYIHVHSTGSPNCPTVHTTVTTTSLTVAIKKVVMTWLPEWYCVEPISYNGSIEHSSSLKAVASFNMTPLQPGTVYNISVIPCNMAGCNESCDIHSVQTESDAGTYRRWNEWVACTHIYYSITLYIAMTVESVWHALVHMSRKMLHLLLHLHNHTIHRARKWCYSTCTWGFTATCCHRYCCGYFVYLGTAGHYWIYISGLSYQKVSFHYTPESWIHVSYRHTASILSCSNVCTLLYC